MPVDTDATANEIAGLRRELKLTWDAHTREHHLHDEAHSREHQFTAEALKVAAELAKENKADANEWRGSMTDREKKFATTEDVKNLGTKIDKLEDVEIRRAETERLRVIRDTEEREEASRRASRSQWVVGLVVGLMATSAAILINLILQLAE